MATFNIQDIDNPQTILGYWDARIQQYQVDAPYLYKQLFTDTAWATPQIGLTYGADLPVRALSASALDAHVTNINQTGFSVKYFNMPFFKNAMLMDETRRQSIVDALYNNPQQGVAESIMRTQLQDTMALCRFATYGRDQMVGQILTKGRIDFPDDPGQQSIDFQLDADQKRGSIAPWGTPDSQPIEDLRKAALYLRRKNSVQLKYAIMNTNTWLKLIKSGELINTLAINRTNNNISLTTPQVTDAIQSAIGITPIVYDKTDGYGNYTIPDDFVSLVPEGALGRMAFTNTPESRETPLNAQVATSGDGITVMTYRENDPVTTTVKVSQRVLPVLDNPYGIMSLKTNQASPDGSYQPSTETNTVASALPQGNGGVNPYDTTNLASSGNVNSQSSASNSGSTSASSSNSGSSSASK